MTHYCDIEQGQYNTERQHSVGFRRIQALAVFDVVYPQQRWKKMAAAAAPHVLIFHSCANFYFFSRVLLKVFGLFCAILGIFANFARFWAFFAHILCANLEVLRVLFC